MHPLSTNAPQDGKGGKKIPSKKKPTQATAQQPVSKVLKISKHKQFVQKHRDRLVGPEPSYPGIARDSSVLSGAR